MTKFRGHLNVTRRQLIVLYGNEYRMIRKYVKQAISTFKVDVKQRKISEISIQHTEADSFEKARAKFLDHCRILGEKSASK